MHFVNLSCIARACLVAFVMLLSFSFQAKSQGKQLTPATKVVNIAYVDQFALRKQYKALNEATKQFADENAAQRKSGQQANSAQRQKIQQQKRQQRLTRMQDYEKKIQQAIGSVVMEGGFTEVQPVTENTTITQGKDITDLVLKKLN